MPDSSFDILFAGKVEADADRDAVRARIQKLFRLTDSDAERLFSGRTITIKRAVDAERAGRLRDAFREAGALVEIVAFAQEETGLRLAPVDDRPLEQPPPRTPPALDVSHLSLVPGSDWTLEDCDRPPPPARIPDISHLRIVEPEPPEVSPDGSKER
jgi:hypothetical protein